MLAALDNGVKGNKWFSLIDKVYRPQTLAAAWQQVTVNKGAAGIDGQSSERFAADAERYPGELAQELKEGRYQAAPVRRVEIPKAGGNRFEAGRRGVRKKSLRALKGKVRKLTRRTRGDSLGRIIVGLNPMLRGWYGYFKHALAACRT